ncbi:hypothetical protein [Bradyrhizobium tropiciagri]|uniref:hypothetical protein n=1 Tax=Bradyrhizobium tropiciagri TaxID=312253 RepID=UPI00067A9426|nr:hypothetical protein [Bradyrhizobium tropiciagri]
MLSGKVEEIIYSRLGEVRISLGSFGISASKMMSKQETLLDATGSMDKVRIERFPHQPRKDYLGN